MKRTFPFAATLFLAGTLAACGAAPETQPAPTAPPTSEPAGGKPAAAPTDSIPSNVKAALKTSFPQASSFTEQHTKHHDGDLHTFIAFTTEGGKKTTLGVGTVVEAKGGKYLLAVDNDVKIINVSVIQSGGVAEVEAADFLNQFAGKTHDDALKLGKDIKFSGTDKAAAEAVVSALRHAEQDLQGLYGKPHTH